MISGPAAAVCSRIAVTLPASMQSLSVFTKLVRVLPRSIESCSVETMRNVAAPPFTSSTDPGVVVPPPFPSSPPSGSTVASQLSHLPFASLSTCSVQVVSGPQATRDSPMVITSIIARMTSLVLFFIAIVPFCIFIFIIIVITTLNFTFIRVLSQE